MATEDSIGLFHGTDAGDVETDGVSAPQGPTHAVIEVEYSGDWLPAEKLKELALKALEEGSDLIFDLDHVNHLDTSALQILLASGFEQRTRGRQVELTHVSPDLRRWLGHAGAAGIFNIPERKANE